MNNLYRIDGNHVEGHVNGEYIDIFLYIEKEQVTFASLEKFFDGRTGWPVIMASIHILSSLPTIYMKAAEIQTLFIKIDQEGKIPTYNLSNYRYFANIFREGLGQLYDPHLLLTHQNQKIRNWGNSLINPN